MRLWNECRYLEDRAGFCSWWPCLSHWLTGWTALGKLPTLLASLSSFVNRDTICCIATLKGTGKTNKRGGKFQEATPPYIGCHNFFVFIEMTLFTICFLKPGAMKVAWGKKKIQRSLSKVLICSKYPGQRNTLNCTRSVQEERCKLGNSLAWMNDLEPSAGKL